MRSPNKERSHGLQPSWRDVSPLTQARCGGTRASGPEALDDKACWGPFQPPSPPAGPGAPGDGHPPRTPGGPAAKGARAAPARARPYLDDALDVPVPLGEVDGAELGRALPVLHVGAEDGAGALPLAPDHAAHGALRAEGSAPPAAVSAAASEGTPSPPP